jgi:polyphosphate:AMP phosphotransferase
MLRDFAMADKPNKDEIQAELAIEREKLVQHQIKVKEAGLPVMVIFEGWGSSGKGSVIGRVIKNIDPRFFRVHSMASPTPEEQRYPFLHRYLKQIPEAGKFGFFDRFWMEETISQHLSGSLTKSEYRRRMRSITTTERSLTDNGYLVMKFFLHISRQTQRKRLDQLLADKESNWRVDNDDLRENENYHEYLDAYGRYLTNTNSPNAPWYIVDATNRKWTELQVLQFLNQGIETALANHALAHPILQNIFALKRMPRLADIELEGKQIEPEEYSERLRALHEELGKLQFEIYRHRIPVIIAYEGWDAAGKGGNIKRITSALDCRGYVVHPIASPEPHEKARHYLWRFWTRLPKNGHAAVFDRTWYGRVLVERLEGFCSENDWQRAYNEINEFERELHDWGAVVIKFWVQIDNQTQLQRFTDRQNNPEKQWKITEEDWRNREKWDAYTRAVDEMIRKTSTVHAPWHILESNDKRYARIKALQILVDALREALENKTDSGNAK